MNEFWDNYVGVLKKYAMFDGRAKRAEFWMYVLVSLIIGYVINLLSHSLSSLYSLAVFVPSIAVGARRLHDTDRSGWWQLIGLIPVLGTIVLIIFFAQPSKRA